MSVTWSWTLLSTTYTPPVVGVAPTPPPSDPVGDLSLTFDPLTGADLYLTPAGDYALDASLRSNVLLSITCDRRDDDSQDGGWWADDLAEVAGDRFGSRLWLLARAKASPETLARAEAYALEALQWLVDDGVAAKVECTAELLDPSPGTRGLGLTVQIYHPTDAVSAFRFGTYWSAA